ncbi:hypothetical protein [Haladaptatus sp. NG-SE-30]
MCERTASEQVKPRKEAVRRAASRPHYDDLLDWNITRASTEP